MACGGGPVRHRQRAEGAESATVDCEAAYPRLYGWLPALGAAAEWPHGASGNADEFLKQLWAYLWDQFNTTAAPPVPQCLELSDADGEPRLSETIQESIHAVSSPDSEGKGDNPAIPKPTGSGCRVKDKLVGAVVLESKPAGFTSPGASALPPVASAIPVFPTVSVSVSWRQQIG